MATSLPGSNGDINVAGALSDLLAAGGYAGSSVTVTSALSAGANRQTLRISVEGPYGSVTDAVAQIAEREQGQSWIVAVDDEAQLLRAAADHGVPVAAVLAAGYCPSLSADVLITRFVDGQTIPRRVLRSLAEWDQGGVNSAQSMAASLGRALAAIHNINTDQLTLTRPLEQFDPAGYVQHLTERLDELPARYPTLRFALGVLSDNSPVSPKVPSLLHGDFRNGNVIVADGEIKAVVDWELVHLGDPMEDLAWLCLRTWRFGIDHNEAGGLTTLAQLRAAYERAGGTWRQDAFEWWSMARTIWWGIGLAAQAGRFMDGTSSSIVHAASGRRVVELEYDLLQLLEPLVI